MGCRTPSLGDPPFPPSTSPPPTGVALSFDSLLSNKHDLSYWSSLSLCSGCWRGQPGGTQRGGGGWGAGQRATVWVPLSAAPPRVQPSSPHAWLSRHRGLCRGGGARPGLGWRDLDPPSLREQHPAPASLGTCGRGGGTGCSPHGEGSPHSHGRREHPPKHRRLPQPFLAPRHTLLLLLATPHDAATAVCFSAALLQEPRVRTGSRGDPSPAGPPPAPGGATRPASASRAGTAAASPAPPCPPATACEGREGVSRAPAAVGLAPGIGVGRGGTWPAERPPTPARC